MLVATAAQTASYPLHTTAANSSSSSAANNSNKNSNGVGGGSGVAPKKICLASSTTTTTITTNNNNASNSITANNNNNNHSNNSHKPKHTESSTNSTSTTNNNNTASALIKTLSVRLNRGTEFIRNSVQKALVSTTTNTTTTTTGSSAISSSQQSVYRSANNKHNNNNNTTSSTTTSSTTSTSSRTSAIVGVGVVLSSSAARTAGPVVLGSRQSAATAATALNKLYAVPPTLLHRYPQKEPKARQSASLSSSPQRVRASSVDSLQREMCHFKPIRAAPTTPWKCGSRSRGGATLRIPQVRLAATTPGKAPLATLDGHCDEDYDDEDDDADDDVVAESRAGVASITVYRPKPGSNVFYQTLATPAQQQQPQHSAFVCVIAATQMKKLVANEAAAAAANNSKATASGKLKQASAKASTKTAKRGKPGRTKAKASPAAPAAAKSSHSSSKRSKKKKRPAAGATASTAKSTGATARPRSRPALPLRSGRSPLGAEKKINLSTELVPSKGLRCLRSNTVNASFAPQFKAATKSGGGGGVGVITSSKNNKKRVQCKSKIGLPKQSATTAKLTSPPLLSSRPSSKRRVVKRAQKPVQVGQGTVQARRVRKRKSNATDDLKRERFTPEQLARPPAVKSARLTAGTVAADTIAATHFTVAGCRVSACPMPVVSGRHSLAPQNRESPPLTRARLKMLADGRLHGALTYLHRIT